jgi:regulator of sigma E protease
MIDFLQHLLAFIVALGILISFHEYGHFWVARKFDVKILRFSIGFGKPLWKKYFGRDKTELVIAAVPLGGYVKMLDEREGSVPPHERDRAFNRKPLGQRTLIVLAGPVFNFIFAIFAYWVMYMVGLTGLKPVVGEISPASIAASAGIKVEDEIIAVGGRKTVTWTMVVDALLNDIMRTSEVKFTLRDAQTREREVWVNISSISIDDIAETGILETLGIKPRQFIVPAIIGEVQAGLAAGRAGLKAGDRIIAADGNPVSNWTDWVDYVRAHPDADIHVEIQRNEERLTLVLRPERKILESGEVIGFIGASNQPPDMLVAEESYSFFPAFAKALVRTWDMSWLTLRMLGKMLTGDASVKNLSGPISIAQYAGQSAQNGIAAFLWFLGIVSVSLGVLNLLPVPLLDGGHLMYYLVEFVKGRPVSESAQILGQQIGLALLFGLMILVFYNDIMRLFGSA